MILPNFFNLRNLLHWKIFAGKILVVRLAFQCQNKYKLWPGSKPFIHFSMAGSTENTCCVRPCLCCRGLMANHQKYCQYVIKHDLNYFSHERGKIKETRKVWHLPVSHYLWQLYKIMFFRFFWNAPRRIFPIKISLTADHPNIGHF